MNQSGRKQMSGRKGNGKRVRGMGGWGQEGGDSMEGD